MLALVLTLARLVYVWWLCPYDLVEDEAFYWEWSLRPDWSYATKGPGVAWAIWLATQLLGTSEGAIRTVPVVAGGLATVAVGLLTARAHAFAGRDASRRVFAAVLGAIAFNLTAAFQSLALLCTIDGPYAACWAWGALFAWDAVVLRRPRAWMWFGVAVGLGVLFKYTMLMVLVGVALAMVLGRGATTRASKRSTVWITLGVVFVVLGLLPIVAWNSRHDWQTVRHLMGHLDLKGGDTMVNGARHAWSAWWPLELIGTQIGVIGPMVVACVAGAWRVLRRAGDSGAQRAGVFLVCLGAPVLVMYFLVSLRSQTEANWPIAGWITLIPLGVLWLSREPSVNHARRVWIAAVIVGAVTGLGMLRLDWVREGIAAISPAAAAKIPIGRFTGAPAMAAHAARLVDGLRTETGKEPMVIAIHYGRASRLRFYMPGRPIVYCASRQTGGRKVQQDYWADVDLADTRLLGRPALLVGGDAGGVVWKRAFERVVPVPGGRLEGEAKNDRPAFLGYGFVGFEQSP